MVFPFEQEDEKMTSPQQGGKKDYGKSAMTEGNNCTEKGIAEKNCKQIA